MPHRAEPRVQFRRDEVQAIYDALIWVLNRDTRGRLQTMWDPAEDRTIHIGYTRQQLEDTTQALRPAIDEAVRRKHLEGTNLCRKAMKLVAAGIECLD